MHLLLQCNGMLPSRTVEGMPVVANPQEACDKLPQPYGWPVWLLVLAVVLIPVGVLVRCLRSDAAPAGVREHKRGGKKKKKREDLEDGVSIVGAGTA
mmetsp:Transcript_6964/g.19795  ORF Transcript_6964/g.19795 Transcript_6964/m.19795 type:complete len:97 (+) Transcript_6964:281-571(+)